MKKIGNNMKIIYVKDYFGYTIREIEFIQSLSDTQILGKRQDEFVIINKTDVLDEELTTLNKQLINAKKLKIKYTAKAEEMSKLVDKLMNEISK